MKSDDYGFSSLHFICKMKDSLLVKHNIDFQRSTQSNFNLEFDLSTIITSPGDVLEYYFEVKDNDRVNGPKTSSSKKQFLKIPDREKSKKISKAKRLRREKSFRSLQKKMISLN